MSLLGNIMSTIFGGSAHAATVSADPAAAGSAAAAGAKPTGTVDVAAVMAELAKKNPEQLDWKRSIVDLMKLVGIESSLKNRKELAKELGFTGDTADTATMNMWLHKQVLAKIAANGGSVPKDLLD